MFLAQGRRKLFNYARPEDRRGRNPVWQKFGKVRNEIKVRMRIGLGCANSSSQPQLQPGPTLYDNSSTYHEVFNDPIQNHSSIQTNAHLRGSPHSQPQSQDEQSHPIVTDPPTHKALRGPSQHVSHLGIWLSHWPTEHRHESWCLSEPYTVNALIDLTRDRGWLARRSDGDHSNTVRPIAGQVIFTATKGLDRHSAARPDRKTHHHCGPAAELYNTSFRCPIPNENTHPSIWIGAPVAHGEMKRFGPSPPGVLMALPSVGLTAAGAAPSGEGGGTTSAKSYQGSAKVWAEVDLPSWCTLGSQEACLVGRNTEAPTWFSTSLATSPPSGVPAAE